MFLVAEIIEPPLVIWCSDALLMAIFRIRNCVLWRCADGLEFLE